MIHNLKLSNMAHALSLNVFIAFNGANFNILFFNVQPGPKRFVDPHYSILKLKFDYFR